ncbi:MAG: hypothetical protein M1820_002386 [Bogoriella megaspora]|nr:MAG: hypothetical protein M1820_002386 [Bogoriella megaspora]
MAVDEEDGGDFTNDRDNVAALLPKPRRKVLGHAQRLNWPLIHVVLILFYTVIVFIVISNRGPTHPLNDGPLRDLSLIYETRTYPNLSGNHLWGPPSPTLEAAWNELLEGINIRVTTAELEAARQDSVKLPIGGGHLAWLSMHHNLHCLRHVHKYTYRDFYEPNRTHREDDHMKLHMVVKSTRHRQVTEDEVKKLENPLKNLQQGLKKIIDNMQ